jgi:hypothetical protein
MTDKKVLTKEERIASLEAQIAKLTQRLDDVRNDRVVAKAKKVVALPEIGDVVAFTYGRTTPTSTARELVGTVIGVKAKVEPGEDGKGGTPALVRVTVGSGFDIEVLTIYPAQIKPETEAPALDDAAE